MGSAIGVVLEQTLDMYKLGNDLHVLGILLQVHVYIFANFSESLRSGFYWLTATIFKETQPDL